MEKAQAPPVGNAYPFEFRVVLPMQSYLKKYLAFSVEVEPFELGHHHFFGDWLMGMMQRPVPGRSVRPVEGEYTDTLEILIPSFIARENRFIIDGALVLRLNEMLNKVMDEEMNRYLLRVRGLPNEQIKVHLLKFRADYGITEDELSFETMKKRHQRWMKRLKKKREKKEIPVRRLAFS